MNDMNLLSFTACIDAEVERAYGVVCKLNLSRIPILKDQTIAVLDKCVATDKLVKRANKVGSTKNTDARFQISTWVEVEHKDGREVLETCCPGKCKERQGIAFFRTWAFQVKQLSECGAPMIFFGAPSHNHRGKKAKFILKLALFEYGHHIATSEDIAVPYKQSSTITKPQKAIKRNRSESEADSDITTPPASPKHQKHATHTSYDDKNAITKLTNNINTQSISALMPAINYHQNIQPLSFNVALTDYKIQSYMNNYGTTHGLDSFTAPPVPSAWSVDSFPIRSFDLHSMWTSGLGMNVNNLRSQSFSFPNASFHPPLEDLTSTQFKIESCISS